MKRITINKPIEVGHLIFEPNNDGTGMWINNIKVSLENVVHASYRVDVSDGCSIVYLVEHVTSAVILSGITDVKVYSKRDMWNFYRPEDRSAFSLKLKPNSVVGDERGIINYEVVRTLAGTEKKRLHADWGTVKIESPITYHSQEGYIRVKPLTEREGIRISIIGHTDEEYNFYINPFSKKRNEHLIEKIASAYTPFLMGNEKEAVYHMVGDLIGDLVGLGGLFNIEVECKLSGPYHKLTFNILKRILTKRSL